MNKNVTETRGVSWCDWRPTQVEEGNIKGAPQPRRPSESGERKKRGKKNLRRGSRKGEGHLTVGATKMRVGGSGVGVTNPVREEN